MVDDFSTQHKIALPGISKEKLKLTGKGNIGYFKQHLTLNIAHLWFAGPNVQGDSRP